MHVSRPAQPENDYSVPAPGHKKKKNCQDVRGCGDVFGVRAQGATFIQINGRHLQTQ